jgi:hypothetical protein
MLALHVRTWTRVPRISAQLGEVVAARLSFAPALNNIEAPDGSAMRLPLPGPSK